MAAEPQPAAQASSWRETRLSPRPAPAARPNPLPPALTYELREGSSLKALQVTAERKQLRARRRQVS